MRLRILLVCCAALALTVGVTAASSSPPVTIGQTLPGAGVCAPSYIVASDNPAYIVPAGTWNVTSWSTQANAAGGSMALVIFRQASPGSYLVVGSDLETLTPNILNTFNLATPIAVQPGDILGMWTNDWTAACADATAGGGNTPYEAYAPLPGVGTTVTPSWTNAYLLTLNISATLTEPAPSLPTSKDQCKNGGWKTFGDQFKNQGDCVSYVATQGKNPPNG